MSKGPYSDIRVERVVKGTLRAVVSLKVAKVLTIRGILLIEGKRGWYMVMPTATDDRGLPQVCISSVNQEANEELLAQVLEAYQKSGVAA